MSENKLEKLLQAGIKAARAGNRADARRLLEAVIAQDDDNELAWIWMASVVGTQRERRICLEKVLQINPSNARAREALSKMAAVDAASGAPSRPAPVVSRSTASRGFIDNPLVRAGLVFMAIIGTLFIASAFLEPQATIFVPSATPVGLAAEPTSASSPTPLPTSTLPIVIVTGVPPTLPPTFTPTPTATATETPLPSPTSLALSDYVLLVSSRDPNIAQPGLLRMRGDGSGSENLLENVRDVRYERNGARVVFIRDVDYPADTEENLPEITVGEIFLAPADNPGAAQQVSMLRLASAYTPSISPDGREIVFASDFAGQDDLWLLDLESGLTTQLTQGTSIDRDPDWSPDGRRVVFTSDRDSLGLTEIYTFDFLQPGQEANTETDSGIITRLTNNPGSSYAPRWSPDGSRIAYVNDRSGFGVVYTMAADGQRPTIITPSTGIENRLPVWSPDGRYIAFLSNRDNPLFSVYMTDLTGREVTRVTQDGRDAQSLSFLPRRP